MVVIFFDRQEWHEFTQSLMLNLFQVSINSVLNLRCYFDCIPVFVIFVFFNFVLSDVVFSNMAHSSIIAVVVVVKCVHCPGVVIIPEVSV